MTTTAEVLVEFSDQIKTPGGPQRARGAAVGWNVVRLPCLCRYSPQSEVQAVV